MPDTSPLGRALEGFRVLDFSAMIAGPYCTRWLADMGADVIKIEPPEGDAMRVAPPVRDGRSAYFGHLNTGKRSVVLDLKAPAALQAARTLAQRADVLVENFRPGVMKRLGLDFATLRALNPRLVYCSISGYGQSGPKSDRPSYAPIVQAASGYEMANFSFQQGLTQPPNTGLFPADIIASCYATIAIQAALLQRSRTGLGQHLDVTLMESILSIMVYEFQEVQFADKRRKILYVPLKTTDGFVIVAPITQRNFENLCEALGHPEWKADARLVDATARRANWDFFMGLIRDWTSGRSGEACETHLLAAGVPCTRYNTIGDVLADPHFRMRGSFAQVDDGAGPFLVPNLPFRMSGAASDAHATVPALGEHTRAVLAEIGLES
jgi:crotonobetainyl-CoA:carnitine CoA-transferase CaiB-like acyl-CoA transferase